MRRLASWTETFQHFLTENWHPFWGHLYRHVGELGHGSLERPSVDATDHRYLGVQEYERQAPAGCAYRFYERDMVTVCGTLRFRVNRTRRKQPRSGD